MKKDFKKIALQLGIAIPVCLLSIEANAATQTVEDTKLIETKKNEVLQMFAMNSNATASSEDPVMGHSNRHTNYEANHSDSHSNRPHSDTHTNRDAYTRNNQCMPHTNYHSDSGSHSDIHSNNGGRQYHTDYHQNRSTVTDC